MTETVEQFLARGGQIETVPRGAMAETGWTGKQFAQAITNVSTAAKKERVAAEAAERKARKAADAAVPAPKPKASKPPKPPRSERPAFSNRNGYDGAKTRSMLAALKAGWLTARQISEASGQHIDSVCARMNQLRLQGVVISHGVRPRMLWALAGTERPATPDVPQLPPNEFDRLTNLQLLDRADELREEISAHRKLIVRIERELKRRKQACR